MTMALPLAFAACTSDEFESFNNQGEALKNRKDLGQVALTVGGDAQTRWTGSMGAEVGDRIGAVLIDNKTADGSEDPMDDYKVSGTEIFTNYMYQNDGTTWRTNANLVEGNYYFYAPYVEYQGRGLLTFATPVVQTIDVDAEGNIEPNSGIANYAEAAESPMVIGYKFLASTDDNTDVTISMKHLFAYPEFKFTNNSGEAVTLSRVLIENTATNEANKFVAGGGLDNEAIGGKSGKLFITGKQDRQSIADAKDAYEAWDQTGESPEFASWGNWQTVFAYDEGGQTIPEGLSDLATADLVANATYTGLIRVDFSNNVTVADGETISFRVIMPAGQYNTEDLALYFVVPDGRAYKVGMWENTSERYVTTMLADRYTAQDYSRDLTLKTGHKQFESEIDEDATLENAPSVVTTTEALIDLLRYERSNENAINITLAGSDIEFNQDVLDAISNMESQSIAFSGLINVVGSKDAEEPMVIDENIAFDEVIVKEGYTTLNHRSLDYEAITVNNGATLTVNSISTSADGALVNKGTLVVDDAVIPSVDNYNAIEFVGSGSIIDLNAEGDEKAKKAQRITVGEDSKFTYQSGALYTIENNGTLTIPAGAQIAANITNNKTVVLGSGVAATNMGNFTNNAAGVIGEAGQTLENKGTLTNYGVIKSNIKNLQPTKAELADDENLTYRVNAKAGSTFEGHVSGADVDTYVEHSVFDVEDNTVNMMYATTGNLTVSHTVSSLTEKTQLPTLVASSKGYINTLTVKGGNIADDADLSTKGGENVTVLKLNGNIAIANEKTLTLPKGATKVEVESNSTLSNGTLAWNNEISNEVVVEIADEATLSIMGATINGNADHKVKFVSLNETKETPDQRGQLRNVRGTLNNCYGCENQSWYESLEGSLNAGTLTATGTISTTGVYVLNWSDAGAVNLNFGKDLAGYVELTAQTDKIARIATSNKDTFEKLTVKLGSKVKVILGATDTHWMDEAVTVNNLPENVIAEVGAKLGIWGSEAANFVMTEKGWAVDED